MVFASIFDLSGMSFDTCDRTISLRKRIAKSAQDTLSSFSGEVQRIGLTVGTALPLLG